MRPSTLGGLENELAFVKSRGPFNSDKVMLVLKNGDLGQTAASVKDVGGSCQQKALQGESNQSLSATNPIREAAQHGAAAASSALN